jgi:chromosome segregation ATPase
MINQAKNTELKSCIKDIEVLENINLSYQKTIEVNQNRIKELKELEALRNVNLSYQKTIEVNQNRINQLNELNKALDTELRNLDTMINTINQSFTWRLIRRYNAIVHKS